MRVLQFGFNPEYSDNDHLPHRYPQNSVCYTGTHDNATIVQWYKEADLKSKMMANTYLGKKPFEKFNRRAIRACYAAPSNLTIIPMQDILGLGRAARMNVPSTVGGNWTWRMKKNALSSSTAKRLRSLAERYLRKSGKWDKE